MLEIPSHYNLVKNYINEKLVENKHLTIIIIYKLDFLGCVRLSSYFSIWHKNWKKLGMNSWNELLIHTFGED